MKFITFCLSLFSIIAFSACGDKPYRPVVMLETTQGNIEIQVYPDKAPTSSADFLLYVDSKFYDNQGFYRVVRADNDPRDMGMSLIQGGRLDSEPLTDPIAHELTSEIGLSNTGGVVSIARDEPGSGSAAYFFINIGDNSFLDEGGSRNSDGQGYATFGKVVKGMDVVRKIQTMEANGFAADDVVTGQILTQPVTILKAYRK